MRLLLDPKTKTRITIKKDDRGVSVRVQGYTGEGKVPYDKYIVDVATMESIEVVIETEAVK